jgi:ParB family transcriptional regulator, chromosome partitioning protein
MPLRSNLRRKVADAFTTTTADSDETAPTDALFDEGVRSGQLRRIPLDQVSPRADQPRQSMNDEGIVELTQSIRDHGVLQPIRVRPKADGGGYEIIAGERRWTAAKQAELREIPAVIVTADDDQAYVEALIENIQREDLNAVDRAHALMRLRVALGRQSWEDVGKVLGIGRQHVHRLLNVTKLPEPIQEDIRVGDLTEKHGRALLTLRAYPQQQMVLWEQIHKDQMTGDVAVMAAKLLRPEAAPKSKLKAAVDSGRGQLVEAAKQLLALLKVVHPSDVGAAHGELAELRSQIDESIARAVAAGTVEDVEADA